MVIIQLVPPGCDLSYTKYVILNYTKVCDFELYKSMILNYTKVCDFETYGDTFLIKFVYESNNVINTNNLIHTSLSLY
jgi:hypothetical protein